MYIPEYLTPAERPLLHELPIDITPNRKTIGHLRTDNLLLQNLTA